MTRDANSLATGAVHACVAVRCARHVLSDVVPTLQGLIDSHHVLYEAVGALWYRYAYD